MTVWRWAGLHGRRLHAFETPEGHVAFCGAGHDQPPAEHFNDLEMLALQEMRTPSCATCRRRSGLEERVRESRQAGAGGTHE